MRKLFKERKLFKGGNYMRKYDIFKSDHFTVLATETGMLLDPHRGIGPAFVFHV